MRVQSSTSRRIRRITAVAIATTFLSQNFAWATCSDGTTFPGGLGFQVGTPALPIADNFAPGVFTGTAKSIFVPDNSVCENNEGTIVGGFVGLPCIVDPSTGQLAPQTHGGHNWVFDQGSTLCKEVAYTMGPAQAFPGQESWLIPPNTGTRCIFLPIIKNVSVGPNSILVTFANLGDIPYQGDVITPVCDPTKLSTATTPNPLNTRANQLGCSISHGVATDSHHADSFLFVSGIKSTMYRYRLTNANDNSQVGSESGKTVGDLDFFAHIFTQNGSPKVDVAAIGLDGMLAVTTSTRRQVQVYTCMDPLGNPGEPTTAINPNFFIPSLQDYTRTKCLTSGQNGLAVDLTTSILADNQPYFGGQRVIQSFQSSPGGASMPGEPASAFYSPAAWPQCHYNGTNPFSQPVPTVNTLVQNLERVFNINPLQGNLTAAGQSGQCGTAQPNGGIFPALATQPGALTRHGGYYDTSLPGWMSVIPTNTGVFVPNPNLTTLTVPGYAYTGPIGGTIDQIKVTVNPLSLQSTYKLRQYATGLTGPTNGIGIAEDLQYPGGAGLVDPSSQAIPPQPGSLMAFTDPSTIGAAGREVVTRMPLCEDLP